MKKILIYMSFIMVVCHCYAKSVIEGEILQISKLPAVKQAPYSDCYYTAECKFVNLLHGKPVDKRIVLVIPGFYNYKLTDLATLKVGDKLELTIVPFKELQKKQQTIQQADDLELFDLEDYFVLSAEKIVRFSSSGSSIVNKKHITKYISGFSYSINPQILPVARKAKLDAISKELKYVNKKLALIAGARKKINKKFFDIWQKRQKNYKSFKKIFRWGYFGNGFFSLPDRYRLLKYNKTWEQNIENIKIFNKFLEANGVQLIIVIIPYYFSVSARIFIPEFAQYPDEQDCQIVKKLLGNDIEAIYITDDVVRNAKKYPFMFFYFNNNSHPGYGVHDIMAGRVAEHLKRFEPELTPKVMHKNFSVNMDLTTYGKNYRYPVNFAEHTVQDTVLCQTIKFKGKLLKFNSDSKILIIGNSYIQTPAKKGAFASALAMKLDYIPDNYRINASGPFRAIPRYLFFNKNKMLKGKRVCILPINADALIGRKFINLRQLDKRLELLSKKQKVFKLKLSALEHFWDDKNKKLKVLTRNIKVAQHHYPVIKIGSKGKVKNITSFDIPENIDINKDTFLMVEFLMDNNSQLNFIVNNMKRKVFGLRSYDWQFVFIKLSIKNRHISLDMESLCDQRFLLIKEISLYQ